MKYSLSWLSDYCQITEINLQKLSDRLTERSAEIDAIHEEGAGLKNIVIGKILEVSAHPDADKLRITKTDVGNGEILQIVCGGQNVKEGMKVVVAKIGAWVRWHGEGDPVEMKLAKVRGVESEGMICASDEVGLSESHPHAKGDILDLSEINTEIGTPLAEVLGKNDTILEVENTTITNRPDLFSHIGFAREMVAIGVANDVPGRGVLPYAPTADAEFPLEIAITDSELCPHYRAVRISGVNGTQESPEWMKKRLSAIGIRAINLLVDVTNYVMFDLGVPMHAFDLSQIKGKSVTMRRSKAGEKVVTLDEVERILPADVIVFEDEQGIFDLCGIMGGDRSGVSDATTDIWLHAPLYHPVLIRRAAVALAHRTDAATIYEKLVPASQIDLALARATKLLLELFPAAKVTSKVVAIGDATEKRSVLLPKALVSTILERSYSSSDLTKILSPLGFVIESENGESWQISIPGFRMRDIAIPEDLIEEIARIEGLETITPTAPTVAITLFASNRKREISSVLRHLLADLGCFEAVNFAFVGEELLKKVGVQQGKTVEVANPISADLAVMRPSLLPWLLSNAESNLKHEEGVRIFEIGNVFAPSESGELPKESLAFSLLCAEKHASFAETKGLLEELFASVNIGIDVRGGNALSYAHLGRFAEIWAQGKKVGQFGQLHPLIAKVFELPVESTFAELDLELIASFSAKQPKYQPLPKFPSIRRDTNIVVDAKKQVGELLKACKGASPLLVSIEITDIFDLPNNEKSVTVSALYRASDRTLADEEAAAAHAEVVKKLLGTGGKLRG